MPFQKPTVITSWHVYCAYRDAAKGDEPVQKFVARWPNGVSVSDFITSDFESDVDRIRIVEAWGVRETPHSATEPTPQGFRPTAEVVEIGDALHRACLHFYAIGQENYAVVVHDLQPNN